MKSPSGTGDRALVGEWPGVKNPRQFAGLLIPSIRDECQRGLGSRRLAGARRGPAGLPAPVTIRGSR